MMNAFALSGFSPEQELVRQCPEMFKLCCRDDRTNTPALVRDALRAADRRLTRQLAEARGERLPRETFDLDRR